MSRLLCRSCQASLEHTFVDLGMSPLANDYRAADAPPQSETFFPLRTYVCHRCFLVQLPEWQSPEEIFSDYAYFSSYSETWLRHAERYTEKMIERFSFSAESQVVEIASNDGYLLQYFQRRGVPVLGIEPAGNVAEAAQAKGIETRVAFFGSELAGQLREEGLRADLLLGNNVLAHTPHLNDFVAGLAILIAENGVITLEFPHLLRMMEGNQFDTIYHEHFSYFSFLVVVDVLKRHGLRVFDVEQLETHGGSLRVYACLEGSSHPTQNAVAELLELEKTAGLGALEIYFGFAEKVRATKRRLLEFLIDTKDRGQKVVGYGAPAKGNTLLNYCGVRTDLLDYTVDRSPHKQGRLLPGVGIPIHGPDHIRETKPDYVLILPWNLRDEIAGQMADVRDWGGRFVVAIPELEVLP